MIIISYLVLIYNLSLWKSDSIYIEEKSVLDNYFIKLVIPKIDLERNLYQMDSELNSVEYNVEVLKKSDINKKIFFLASHSGNSGNCFFNRVKELELGDYVYILYNNSVLVYEIDDRYFIVKNGYMEVSDDIGLLYLITCDIYNSNRQLIIKGVLVN